MQIKEYISEIESLGLIANDVPPKSRKIKHSFYWPLNDTTYTINESGYLRKVENTTSGWPFGPKTVHSTINPVKRTLRPKETFTDTTGKTHKFYDYSTPLLNEKQQFERLIEYIKRKQK